ncbi:MULTISPECIES: lanthionine synthetase C family protein [unclassified Streptomyces]|uniref:lanthionine synthetase C family protein n=1 Tax=unclassified Streptomyces TaxID=2593676 RepID=UPI000F4313DD|nr:MULTISPECIES: lanthionine synthetase C family protein [unclassified Streptomyces]AYV32901.1 Lanthionine synthetase C-like protein [Streptomyces sp. ADI95-16]MCX4633117.1 lanthionine synthetase C family protein [Streptomyces sp. NBC_01443]
MIRPVERGRWTALLSGPAAAKAVTVAVEVAEAVEALPPADVGPSLCDGAAGFAVLNAYLALALDDAAAAERAETWLRRAMAGLRVRPRAGLFAGVAGVGWAASHVTRLLGLEAKSLDPTTHINRALMTRLARSPWCAPFDLVSGLAGYGVYALQCLPTPGARECLEGVVRQLGELAIHTPEGVTWHTGPELLRDHQRRQSPDGHHNLGVAHGVPGVLAVLALSAAAGVARPQAAVMASGAVDWLLAQRLDDTSPSRLPYWLNTDGFTVPARTAWCYGDAGAAMAVLVAARSLGVTAWEAEATVLARAAAVRAPEDTGVTDAWLCHGSAGLAHVFNRMWQATGDGQIGEGSRFWFMRTFDFHKPGGGDFAGYPKPDPWDGDGSSLLTGATGVALALLAAATAMPPSWDRTLLASPIFE